MTAGASDEVRAFVAAVAAENRRQGREGSFCKCHHVVCDAALALGRRASRLRELVRTQVRLT